MIELLHIHKAFGGVPVLRDVTLRLAEGETVSVAGRSGIGKTTLLRILMGLERPDAGAVCGTNGVRFAAVFQEDRLIEHLSALDNLRFACGARPDADTALRAVGLSGADARKRAASLSGGQRRRVALLRALLCPSDVLVLDEPFTGLDDAARAQCLAAVAQYRAHRTLVLVTHDAADAQRLAARVFSVE